MSTPAMFRSVYYVPYPDATVWTGVVKKPKVKIKKVLSDSYSDRSFLYA